MNIMRIYGVLILLTLGISLQAATQMEGFKSTSSMLGSGSIYSSNPKLNADGIAVYDGVELKTQAQGNISGPRRVAPVTPTGEPTPMGDPIVPLVLMSLLFGGRIYNNKKNAAKTKETKKYGNETNENCINI